MSYNPYNQPTQGGPQHQPPPLPQSLLPHQRLWRWYRRKSRRTQLGLGCLTLLLLFSCSICGVAAAATGSTPTATITPTATTAGVFSDQQTPTQAVQIATTQPTATATPSPTPKPTPRPTPKPTQAPKPTATPAPKCQAVNGNPWCYNFTPGSLIYSPNTAFCDYFACVSTFWSASRGYVAECANGSYTHSGGVSGACSRDGGVARILYSH